MYRRTLFPEYDIGGTEAFVPGNNVKAVAAPNEHLDAGSKEAYCPASEVLEKLNHYSSPSELLSTKYANRYLLSEETSEVDGASTGMTISYVQ